MNVFDAGDLPASIGSKSDYGAFLAADLAAVGLTRWRFDSRWRQPVLGYLRALRRVEYLRTKKGALARIQRFWARYRLQALGLRSGITIPPGVAGPGVSVAHYGSVVVNTKARIGAFSRLHPGVTIGKADGGVPRIGSFVYLGPNAVIYGDVTIGDCAVIGANSVVNRDVPAGVTFAGVPARQVSESGSLHLMPESVARYYPREDGT